MNTLTLTNQDGKFEFNIEHLDATQLLDVIQKISNLEGYHPVSFWRALKYKAEDCEELFESIYDSRDEWEEADEDATTDEG